MLNVNTAAANAALVRSLYAAFGSGDIPMIIGAMADDVDWTVIGERKDFPLFGSWLGKGRVEEFFGKLLEVNQFNSFEPRGIHATDDMVFVPGHYEIVVKKTGREIVTDWIHVWTIRDGNVVKFREHTDTAQFAAAYRG